MKITPQHGSALTGSWRKLGHDHVFLKSVAEERHSRRHSGVTEMLRNQFGRRDRTARAIDPIRQRVIVLESWLAGSSAGTFGVRASVVGVAAKGRSGEVEGDR
ncbi:hypothetical protein [Pinisolibacter sp.]|uniref:hypothetical protein n=1 Tax=Pinisolibacter sp. TaxID=2172024 RepID=UPI002FDD1D47